MLAWQATGADQPFCLGFLAEAYRKIGRANEGLDLLDLALVEVHKSKEGFREAELHRLRGELLRMHDSSNSAEAEACFRTAIEIAREQSAQSLELRATTSRARLLAKRDQRDEALLSLSL